MEEITFRIQQWKSLPDFEITFSEEKKKKKKTKWSIERKAGLRNEETGRNACAGKKNVQCRKKIIFFVFFFFSVLDTMIFLHISTFLSLLWSQYHFTGGKWSSKCLRYLISKSKTAFVRDLFDHPTLSLRYRETEYWVGRQWESKNSSL